MAKMSRQEAASKGGKAAHEKGAAFEFKAGSDKAKEAGKRGVKVRQGICPDCGARFMTAPTEGCEGCKKCAARQAKREAKLPVHPNAADDGNPLGSLM